MYVTSPVLPCLLQPKAVAGAPPPPFTGVVSGLVYTVRTTGILLAIPH